jgi:hypothetical protein
VRLNIIVVGSCGGRGHSPHGNPEAEVREEEARTRYGAQGHAPKDSIQLGPTF